MIIRRTCQKNRAGLDFCACSKLKDKSGLTMAETLVALAIVALIGVALTLGINSAVQIKNDSSAISESRTLCGTLITALENEFRFADNIETDAGGNIIKYDSPTFGTGAYVYVLDGKIYVVAADSTAYQLVSDAAYTGSLSVSEKENEFLLIYNETANTVKITINVGADGAANTKQSLTVSVLN